MLGDSLDGPSSSVRIGSAEDLILDERLHAATVAFNALAKAGELRAKIEASYASDAHQGHASFLAYTPLGPMMAARGGNVFRPIANWVRSVRVGRLDAKGNALMPKEGSGD